MDNSTRLARIQRQVGVKGYGVYYGVGTSGWRQPEARQAALALKNQGANCPDYVLLKCGEWGIEWYDGTFPQMRQAFLDFGIGCAPYYFCRPQTAQSDAAVCAKLAKEAGIVVLDCEEQWNAVPALDTFLAAVRSAAGPDPVLLVTGYADPETAVPAWDFHCLESADGYQGQFYTGWWSRKGTDGIDWGIGQIAQRLEAAGLGADYPIQLALNVENVPLDVLQAECAYALRWRLSPAIWVQQDMTTQDYAVCRQGSGATGVSHAPAPPSPAPPPPPTPRTYIVQAGDSLSAIATKLSIAGGWQALYNANKAEIGDNPNLIHPGEVLVLP